MSAAKEPPVPQPNSKPHKWTSTAQPLAGQMQTARALETARLRSFFVQNGSSKTLRLQQGCLVSGTIPLQLAWKLLASILRLDRPVRPPNEPDLSSIQLNS